MRVIIIIVLFLQVSSIYAQDQNQPICSLNEALQTAIANKKDLAEIKSLKNEVKAIWYSWMYSIIKWQTLHEYMLAISDLNRIAVLHYESGDADLYETSALVGKLADIETSTLVASNEIEINKTLLSRLLLTDDMGIPADTSISIYEIDKGPPELYPWTSELDSVSGNDEFLRAKTITIKGLELDNLFIRLQYFRNYALGHAETTIKSANAAFKLEEIDYIEYIHKLGEAFKIKLEYIELLNNYNQKAIQLEFYAY
jgi:hypothetical protein